jgi:two-component system phosphate regulon response regulator PhoB
VPSIRPAPEPHPGALHSLIVESKRLGPREWFVVRSPEDLPDASSNDATRGLRSILVVPIVVVTGSVSERDRIVSELVRHIDSAQREEPAPDGRLLNVGDLRIDKEAHRVTLGGEEIVLTQVEFRLLVTLIERRDRVQTRGVLLHDVWSVDRNSRTRTVDTHVKRLRDKLRSAGRFIQTVRGIGYRFSLVPASVPG